MRAVSPIAKQIQHAEAAGAAGAASGAAAPVLERAAMVRGIVQVVVRGEAHSMAREIAASTPLWDRVTTDSRTGTVLKVDRYRPSEEIKRILMARDQHCRLPGCRVPAHRGDLDHTVNAAKGGETSNTNLGALCRGHHMLKHHGGWQVAQLDGGVYEWRSPTGRTHVDRLTGLFAPRQGAAREQARGAPSRGAPSWVRFEPVPVSG